MKEIPKSPQTEGAHDIHDRESISREKALLSLQNEGEGGEQYRKWIEAQHDAIPKIAAEFGISDSCATLRVELDNIRLHIEAGKIEKAQELLSDEDFAVAISIEEAEDPGLCTILVQLVKELALHERIRPGRYDAIPKAQAHEISLGVVADESALEALVSSPMKQFDPRFQTWLQQVRAKAREKNTDEAWARAYLEEAKIYISADETELALEILGNQDILRMIPQGGELEEYCHSLLRTIETSRQQEVAQSPENRH